MQTSIPCVMMRGGTSRGLYFLGSDLPADPVLRDRVLLAAMGSPDSRQIDGAGGATSVTSKVAIVSPSDHPSADVDYLFAQVGVENATVDTGPSCGNILSGVAPFAIEQGLLQATDGETTVRIRNVNTGALIEAVVRTPGGYVEYEGETAIDGVPGTASPIPLGFLEPMGSKTGALFPTGLCIDTIDGIDVTCVDGAMPMVVIAAAELGLSGYEMPAELDANAGLLDRLENIRCTAARLMGLGDVREGVVPKLALVAPARNGGTICSRYFVPARCHGSYAATGAITLASCVLAEGTVAARVAAMVARSSGTVVIEHPAGRIAIDLVVTGSGVGLHVARAFVTRTARPIFAGSVMISGSILAHVSNAAIDEAA